jgi:(4S)-4-hydroxy-5-phosphonooxypentane-2,3-dione isomerase
MHIAIVHVHVKEDAVEGFKQAILDNAKGSIEEAGVVRFDILQQAEDSTRFTLVEVYKTPQDQEKHRETKHYLQWREQVAEMMAEPRQAIRYVNLYPEDASWR